MSPTSFRWRSACFAGLSAVIACAGCGADPPREIAPSTPSVPVIQPGRPGEPNATLTGSAAASVTTPTATPADSRFVRDMIVHHAQAVVLVDAVRGDLADAEVNALAARIAAEQRPEMTAMATWLEGRGQPVPREATNPHLTDHDTHSMPGMVSAAEIQRLAGLRGTAADRLFLAVMMRHHRGALEMVRTHAPETADEQVEQLANEIAVSQGKQIEQMRAMSVRLT